MKFNFKKMLFCVVAAGLTMPATVQATNGYFLIGFGSESRAMGGTGVADNRSAMAAAFNPASMIDSTTEFQLGAEIFVPPRAIRHDSTILGFTDERSNHDIFLIPSMGLTYEWGENSVVGFAFIGAGLKTEFNQASTSDSCQRVNAGSVPGFSAGGCPSTVFNALNSTAAREAGVELVQMQFIPSFAYKLNKTDSWGASIVLAGQFFRAEGLEDFSALRFTSSPGSLTGRNWDHSFGGGYRLGWLSKLDDEKFRLGFNYSSRVWMKEFGQYKNLFAEQGDFDIPENYAVGIAYDFTPTVTVALDIQRIRWSTVKSVGNPGPDASNPDGFFSLCADLPTTDSCKLGGENGLGFGWKDRTVYKLGASWAYNDKWDLRAGWNYGKSPIEKDQVLFNMLAPATPEHHFTVGAGWAMAPDWKLDVNFMYAPRVTIKGPTVFGVGGAIVTGSNASIAMKQYSLGATLGVKF